ncbi:MaoC/PaaZ C-terminal domain-containing protein [Henriciella aquimarina]|uniref:MaoC/PaaZ C-terminal domain-containing protein n=1 Tax=Henriciella aquimarina TaxID=545261 RepID=UPI000A06404B|nr:MaoC/PaaZ C-terminal domain-containing protein [Henriciella aquimarina]
MEINRDASLPDINHEQVMSLSKENRHEWSQKDAMLYALGIGLGADPLDRAELGFVYEKQLKVFPTFPVVVGFNGGALEDVGIDYRYVLHGEHAVTLHKRFPSSGQAVATSRMLGAWDKGPGRGAVFSQEKVMRLEGDQEPLATIRTTSFARAEGGFGGPRDGQPEPHSVPSRAPDKSVRIGTTQNQALLYRLSGDDNPLHADPDAALAAGFPQPILHGLCTFAICCRAVLKEYCDNDPSLVTHHEVRFSSPVYPGETLTVDLWKDGNVVSFEAHVTDRAITAIRNGKTLLAHG